MSRTYRNVEEAKWYRSPRINNFKQGKARYIEEVKEELGSNYIRPRDVDLNLPQTWDDRHCHALIKEWTEEAKVEHILASRLDIKHDNPTWFLDTNLTNRTIWVSNSHMRRKSFNNKVNYLPFVIKANNHSYYVKVNKSSWRF